MFLQWWLGHNNQQPLISFLSVLSGNIPNSVPSLEDETVEIVHKPPMKQCLANNDFSDAINAFNDGQGSFLLSLLKTKQQLNVRQYRTAKEMRS